ncbi:MAG TPA: NmrA family NAD(P)-binding protein [Xanthobacteraceae bacterium]|nr:NmrA family NAD(P)-binding protein [Xanthobacteraceae bacterium]
MILVTGAAGKTGKAVVKALAVSGARVRALVRARKAARRSR